MDIKKRAYLIFHFCVILWGFTAILGDLISLSAIVLVWWRVFLTSIGMYSFSKVRSSIMSINRSEIWRLLGIGVVIGAHWICFYGSVKLANASIALIGLSLTAFFTALVEPLLSDRSFSRSDLLFGLAVIPGIILIAGGLEGNMMVGLIVGLIAALLSAVFAIMNKTSLHITNPETMTFVEMSGAWLFMNIVLLFAFLSGNLGTMTPSSNDWFWIFVLVCGCTIVPFILHLIALRHLTAFASNLITHLEPVYGILMAYFILKDHEQLSPSFYWGGAIVMATVFLYPVMNKTES